MKVTIEAVLFFFPLVSLVIGKRDSSVLEKLGLDRIGSRIRCPRCSWVPRKHDTWLCDPGCGHVWNTFDTRGRCPQCDKRWQQTVCLRCREWSNHDSWYEREPVER